MLSYYEIFQSCAKSYTNKYLDPTKEYETNGWKGYELKVPEGMENTTFCGLLPDGRFFAYITVKITESDKDGEVGKELPMYIFQRDEIPGNFAICQNIGEPFLFGVYDDEHFAALVDLLTGEEIELTDKIAPTWLQRRKVRLV